MCDLCWHVGDPVGGGRLQTALAKDAAKVDKIKAQIDAAEDKLFAKFSR